MPHIKLSAPFLTGFDRIRASLDIPETFPAEVLADAEAATPAGAADVDLVAVPFIAIDPPGAVDLDQAFWGEPTPTGHRILYAIADVGAFVRPGGAVDAEARERGVTMYSPDRRTPLHPVVLSEDRASLLPGVHRRALVWEIDLDEAANPVGVSLRRAEVRVAEAISYDEAQRRIDAGLDGRLDVMAAVGAARIEREIDRGGVSLGLPVQRVLEIAGGYEVRFDEVLAVERWNAQISLLTGMVAAGMMAEAGVGIVRTLPSPTEEAVALLRRHASALRLDWPSELAYPGFVRSVDASSPAGAAFLYQAARTLRGAAYQVIEPGHDVAIHGAIAAPYAHVTAPLRRLVDRFANEILLAIAAGATPPVWAVEALDGLPGIMARAHQRQNALERAVVDFTEAVVLAPHVGEVFEAEVVDLRDGGSEAVITLTDHAVVATVDAPDLDLGAAVRLRLVGADPRTAVIVFQPVGQA